MTSLRQTLKRHPLAVDVYLRIKRVAHRVFPPDMPGPAPACTQDASIRAAPTAEPVAPAPVPQPEAAAPAEPADQPESASSLIESSDFDIYRQYPPHVFYTFRDKDARFRDAAIAYCRVPVEDEPSGLYSDPIRVLQFFQMVEAANKLDAGDYVELGSHRGFSLRVIHRFMDQTRRLYSFDTFEGFDERDITIEKSLYDAPWSAGTFAPTSVERVAQYVGDGAWPENLTIVKGWFPESYANVAGAKWRFVHIDFDLYQPIKAALEATWTDVVPGGIVMVHDYGCYGFPAARRAVDEFAETIGLLPIELVDRWSTAVFRKPTGRQA
jgi:hypothetical protein